jgi:integrase/recombinase XerD
MFLNARAQAMTRSGFEYVLKKHVATAARKTTSLVVKNVSPHILRHTCALRHPDALDLAKLPSVRNRPTFPQTTSLGKMARPTE